MMISKLIDLLTDCEIFNYSLALKQIRSQFTNPENICDKTLIQKYLATFNG